MLKSSEISVDIPTGNMQVPNRCVVSIGVADAYNVRTSIEAFNTIRSKQDNL